MRSSNIGAERFMSLAATDELMNILEQMGDIESLDGRSTGMIIRYLCDMSNVLSECRRVLKGNGQAIFVIGNSAIRGIYINNSEALINLAQKRGFKLTSRVSRPLPEYKRYLPPPNSKKSGKRMSNRMREEVILRFTTT